MFDYDAYNLSSKQQKLVIFLHGYNSSQADYENAVTWLKEKVNNSYLIVPQAPEISEKNPYKRQWFGMIKYDPDKKRYQNHTSVDEIFAIYNKAQQDISKTSANINLFIDQLQKKFDITNQHTFLIGFSQGAMLTLCTAITRHQKLGGVFAISGLLAKADFLENNVHSKPLIHLFHGKNDTKVQYKTLESTVNWLRLHQIDTKINTYDELNHTITQEEINTIAQTINNTN